jgi:hypothetical protein
MPLREEISLTQRQLKIFGVFPHFFETALNNFYFLTDQHGFHKPKIATWKNEGQVKYISEDFEVIIEYEYPDWVDVTFRISDRPGWFSLRKLVTALGLRNHPDKPDSDQDFASHETEDKFAKAIQSLSAILQENSVEIFTYLRDTAR